jgi:type I restriction enzyme S subunit
MASEWQDMSLGEFVILQRGHDLTDSQRRLGKVPVMGSAGQNGYHDTARAKGPGVIIGRSGASFGQVHISPEDFWPHNTTLYVTDFLGNDPKFVYYFLKSINFGSYNSGSAQASLNRNFLYPIRVRVPKPEGQKRIAHILGTLDDKIELNRRMNATLEAMARALFQSWFVDFDPVRAKAAGQTPAGMDPATADLFPSEFQDSELGEIPKGWKVCPIGEVLSTLETGRRPKGGVSGYTVGVPSVGAESIWGIGQFDFGKTKFVPKEFYEKTSAGRVLHNDVLLYKDGGKPGVFKPRVGMFGHGFPFDRFCINEHVFRMRSDSVGQIYLYFTVSGRRVLEDYANKGGKAAIPGINQVDVRSVPVLRPPTKVLAAFDRFIRPLCDRILQNAKQSRTLATLRDTLLPKLLSGEMSVQDVVERRLAV